MRFKGQFEGIRAILAVATLATVLTACDGSSADNGTTTSAATSTAGLTEQMSSVRLSSADYQVTPSSSAIITIYRSGPAKGAATVGYDTVNGSAVAGTDYTASKGTVTWNEGDTSPRTIIVPVARSGIGKTFAISLSNIEGSANFGDPAAATVTVVASSGATSGSSSGSTSGTTSTGVAAASSSGGSASTSSGGSTSTSSGGSTVASGGTSSGGASSGGSTTASGSGSSSGSSTGTKTATLQWSAPTENSNGTALTNLAGYNIYYGNSTGTMTNKITVNTVGLTTYVIQNMNSGTWYFAMTAVNSAGAESAMTSTVQASL